MSRKIEELIETLVFTVGVINRSRPDERYRISLAYADAQRLIRDMEGKSCSDNAIILSCLDRFRSVRDAGDIAAAGWMLATIQVRVDRADFPYWQALKRVANNAQETLPALSPQTVH